MSQLIRVSPSDLQVYKRQILKIGACAHLVHEIPVARLRRGPWPPAADRATPRRVGPHPGREPPWLDPGGRNVALAVQMLYGLGHGVHPRNRVGYVAGCAVQAIRRREPYGRRVTTLPTWAVYVVALGTPLLTLLGVLFAQAVIRRGAGELETRSRREETFRVLRWAAELAVSDDEGKANLGVYELNALADSALLDSAQSLFVNAALGAVVDTITDKVEEAGDDVEVMATDGPDVLPDGPETDVPSTDREDEDHHD